MGQSALNLHDVEGGRMESIAQRPRSVLSQFEGKEKGSLLFQCLLAEVRLTTCEVILLYVASSRYMGISKSWQSPLQVHHVVIESSPKLQACPCPLDLHSPR